MSHHVSRHVVGDDRHRNVQLLQLPRGEPGALQVRPGFVGDDADPLAGFRRGPDDPQRSPVTARGQGAGVAVGEHRGSVRDQRLTEGADAPVARDVLVQHGAGLRLQPVGHLAPRPVPQAIEHTAHPVRCPEQVDRRGPRAGDGAAHRVEAPRLLAPVQAGGDLPRPEGDAHRRGDADGRGAADHHVADGIGNLLMGAAAAERHLVWKQPLVDHHDAVGRPFDGRVHEASIPSVQVLFDHLAAGPDHRLAGRRRLRQVGLGPGWKPLGRMILQVVLHEVDPDGQGDAGARLIVAQ